MARFVEDNATVLDIATGTGDVIISLTKQKKVKMAVGIDMAQNMLLKAQSKIKDNQNVSFLRADAMKLPFFDRSFDMVTIAFGIRNMPDPAGVLE